MEELEQLEVVRKHNRALRKVNKQLRRALENLKDYSDHLFLELCSQEAVEKEN